MASLFPFGEPAATRLYLLLCVVTEALHFLFVAYILGGACLLAFGALTRRGAASNAQGRTALDSVRDWLPFALGLTITAGVAPLLFIQVLYPLGFYTANLLQVHRWMAILPVLAVGFYALYLGKTDLTKRLPRGARVAIDVLPVLCLLFIGMSWAQNHLLTLDRDHWVELYRSGALFYGPAESYYRVAFFLAAAFPVVALASLCDLEWTARRGRAVAPGARRGMARMGLLAILGAALVALAWYRTQSSVVQDVFATNSGRAYLALMGFGGLLLGASYVRAVGRDGVDGLGAAAAWAGTVFCAVAVAALREMVRVSKLDLASLYPEHAARFEAGGLWLFVVMMIVVGAAVVYILRVSTRVQAAP